MAETDIELRVSLDDQNVVQNSKKLQKEVQRVFDSVDTKKLDSGMKSILSKMSELSSKADKAQSHLREMENAYPHELSSRIEKTTENIDVLSNRINTLQSQGAPTEQIESLERSRQVLQNNLQLLQEQQQQIQQGNVTEVLRENNEEYVNTEQNLRNINNQLAVVTTKAYEAQPALREALSANVIENIGMGIQRLSQNVSNAGNFMRGLAEGLRETGGTAGMVLGTVSGALGRVTQVVGRAMNLAGRVITKVGTISEKVFKKMVAGLKQVAKWAGGKVVGAFKSLGSKIASVFVGGRRQMGGFGTSFKSLLGSMLGAQGIVSIFNKLKSAIGEGIQNLARWRDGNNETNRSISMLMSSATQLKNSLAAAFAPILSIVAPVLNRIIQLCIAAANAIGKFFAALGGKTKFIQAKKVQQNYAESLDNTASSASHAAEELGKLGEYDELKVIGNDNNSAGGGGGGGGAGGLDPNDMFEEVPIDSNIQDLVDKIKKAWEDADFTEIGRMLGEKVKGLLEDAEKFLDGPGKEFAEKLGKSIATFLNGFFETPGLGTQLGKTIGALLNDALVFLDSFITNLHWDSIGKFIADAIMGFTDKFDWDLLGKTVGDLVNGIFDLISGFAENYDGTKVGSSIAKAINKAVKTINWKENASNLSALVNDLFDTINSFLDTVDWRDFGKNIMEAIMTFFDDIDYSKWGHTLSSAISSLADFLTGLVEGVNWEGLPKSIIDNVAEFFKGIDWKKSMGSVGNLAGSLFKAVFDIGKGLAEVFGDIGKDILDYFVDKVKAAGWDKNNSLAENGKALIEGIFNGIVDFFKGIGNWVKENILDPFVKGFKDTFSIHSPASNPTIVELGTNLIKGVFEGVINWMKDIGGWVKENVLDKFAAAFEKGKEITITLAGKVKDSFDSLKKKYDAVKDKAAELVATAKDKLGDAYTRIKSAWDSIKTRTARLTAKIKNSMGKAADKVSSIWGAIGTKTATLTAKFRDLFSAAFKRVWNGLVRGVNTGISVVNKIPGVNIPKMSYLAKGAVIPPNREFMAVLGDQKQGVNIETPLDTMIEAFNTALANNFGGNNQPIVLQLNGRQIAKAVWDENDKRYKQTGNFKYAYS